MPKVFSKRLAWLGIIVALCGCVRIPFVHKHRDKPRPAQAVQQFADEAQALTHEPDAPALFAVTRTMSVAIEGLPDVDG